MPNKMRYRKLLGSKLVEPQIVCIIGRLQYLRHYVLFGKDKDSGGLDLALYMRLLEYI